jgi:hypothetical protein
MLAKRLSKIFLSVATAATLFGCGNGIGSLAVKDELKGDLKERRIFPGGPEQDDVILNASNLKENETYNAEGKLTVNGNIPKNVTLQIEDGKLVVNGNIGAGSTINVDQPVASHTEDDPGYDYSYNMMSGKYEWHYDMLKTKTVIDGLRYNDPEPAVQVNGSCGASVSISSNGEIVVKGHQIKNNNQITAAPRSK